MTPLFSLLLTFLLSGKHHTKLFHEWSSNFLIIYMSSFLTVQQKDQIWQTCPEVQRYSTSFSQNESHAYSCICLHCYIGLIHVSLLSDCRAVCHPDCKDGVPLPCVPCKNTPGSAKMRPVGTLWCTVFLNLWLSATEQDRLPLEAMAQSGLCSWNFCFVFISNQKYCLWQEDALEFYAPTKSPMIPDIVVSKQVPAMALP